MIFDIKEYDPKMIKALTDLIKSKNLYAKTIVISFNPCALFTIKRVDRNILTGLTIRAGYMSYEDLDRRILRNSPPLQYIDFIIDGLIELGVHSFVLPAFLGVDMLLLHYKCVNRFVNWMRQMRHS
ncbi:hypothetical protein COOONC_13435 [Cooperia oncophora]